MYFVPLVAGKDSVARLMRRLLIFWLLIVYNDTVCGQEIPYKPDSEFELRINMNFKVRPPADVTKIKVEETFGEYEKRTSNTPLPFVVLLLNVVKAREEEVRLSVSKNGKAYYSRKVETGKDVKLDIGFSDDIKDRTIEHEYEITFFTDRKKPVSRILIYFSEEGDYLVNGVKRGRI